MLFFENAFNFSVTFVPSSSQKPDVEMDGLLFWSVRLKTKLPISNHVFANNPEVMSVFWEEM